MIRQKKDKHIDLRLRYIKSIETEHHKEIDRFTFKLPFFCFHPFGSKPIYFTYILRYIIALQQTSLGLNQDNHSEYVQL